MTIIEILLLFGTDNFHFEYMVRENREPPAYYGRADFPYDHAIILKRPEARYTGMTESVLKISDDIHLTMRTFADGEGCLRMEGISDVNHSYQDAHTIYMDDHIVKAVYRNLLMFREVSPPIRRLKMRIYIRDRGFHTIKTVVN